jgi:hypothetical protein
MRRLFPLLPAAALLAGCYAAPGTPQTDIGASSTAETGHYRVVERQAQDGRYHLKVQAALPENADLIATKLVHQLRPLSPNEVVVEIGPLEGRTGEARTITWTRPQGTRVPREPGLTHGTAAADRQPDRHPEGATVP